MGFALLMSHLNLGIEKAFMNNILDFSSYLDLERKAPGFDQRLFSIVIIVCHMGLGGLTVQLFGFFRGR